MNPDFEDIFDSHANEFVTQSSNFVSWKYMWIPILDKHITFKRNMNVLDEWSASWRVSKYLIEKWILAKNITWVEISSKQVEIAKQLIPEANFIHGDIRNIELPNSNFELAISNMVLEFLDNDWLKQSFQITYDSLIEGGEFIVITTHPKKLSQNYWIKDEWWYKVKYDWWKEGYNFYRNVNTFLDIAKEIGFKIEAVEELEIPEIVKLVNLEEYNRYKQYEKVRLGLKLVK